MVSFSRTTARMYPDFVNITFAIDDTSEDISKYKFSLYRSFACNGDFELVLDNILEFECNDYSAYTNNPEILHFYKILVTDTKTGKSEMSAEFTTPSAPQDQYAFYLCNIYDTYLESVIDNPTFYLLKRIRMGEVCECFDDVRGTSSDQDRCPICFGMGYKGGFFKSIPIKLNLQNAQSKQEEMHIAGTVENKSPIQAWTSGYPIIQEGDMIVDTLHGDRFIVMSWQPSYKTGYLIRQSIQMIDVQESSLLYSVPLKNRG